MKEIEETGRLVSSIFGVFIRLQSKVSTNELGRQ